MGWASEKIIEEHNARMESDVEYAEKCRWEWAMEDSCRELEPVDETQIDWFDEYRIDHSGYEENLSFNTFYSDEDLPF